jgi:arsenate reductase
MADTTIYQQPRLRTSRNALALLRQAGIEPVVVEYLKTPPSKEKLRELVAAMGIPVRALLREKEALHAELQLGDAKWSDDRVGSTRCLRIPS